MTEKKIYLDEVMPVIQFGGKRLESTKLSKKIRLNYEKKLNIL